VLLSRSVDAEDIIALAPPIMVSKVLRFLSVVGEAGGFSARCTDQARRLNLTFTRL
jgi:hypothetical protein